MTEPRSSFPKHFDELGKGLFGEKKDILHVPLEVVRSRILVFSIRTKWANIARRIVYQTMSNHLVLSLKAFSTFASGAAFDHAVVRPIRRMNIGMRIEEILSCGLDLIVRTN